MSTRTLEDASSQYEFKPSRTRIPVGANSFLTANALSLVPTAINKVQLIPYLERKFLLV